MPKPRGRKEGRLIRNVTHKWDDDLFEKRILKILYLEVDFFETFSNFTKDGSGNFLFTFQIDSPNPTLKSG